MSSYNDRFGGSTVQPADVSYRSILLTANITLEWPALSVSDSTVLARIMDVSVSTAGLSITLPDSQDASLGQDMLFRNTGTQAFSVRDHTGGLIATVAPGQVKYIYLIDNATEAGSWVVILFGSGSSTLDASQLAGYGLMAENNELNFSSPVTIIGGATTIDETYRAATVVWTGGTGTLTLALTSSVGADFAFAVRNQGTGVLTLAPSGGETIDGSASSAYQLGESAIIHSGSGAWFSVGRGRSTQFNFTQLVKNVTGGTVNLSLTEAANVVQTYRGTLTSSCSIVLPAVVQVYYVSNQTSGAFSLTFRSPVTGTTVTVPTGQNAVLFCDGTDVINASTTVAGLSSLLLAAGSAASPSLGVGAANTGLYSSGSNEMGITSNGQQVGAFDPDGLKVVGNTVSSRVAIVAAANDVALIADRPAAKNGYVRYRTAGSNRWALTADSTAESGSNAGTNFKLQSFTDAGAALMDVMTATRSTGAVSFGQNVSAVGAMSAASGSFPTFTAASAVSLLGNSLSTFVAGLLPSANQGAFRTAIGSTATGDALFTAASATAARSTLATASTSELQAGTYQRFTTAGTSTAYTLTPSPAIAAYTAGLEFDVQFHTASGANPTLQISGLATPPNIVVENPDGTYSNFSSIPANHRSRVLLLSATQALLRDRPTPVAGSDNVGYLSIPQNSQSAAYTLVLADAGKHLFHPSADVTARTWTIPANSSVAFPIGTAVTFVNQNGAGAITIAITTDTMRLAGAGTTGSRTLAANGIATALKVTATEWIISGTGLT